MDKIELLEHRWKRLKLKTWKITNHEKSRTFEMCAPHLLGDKTFVHFYHSAAVAGRTLFIRCVGSE